MDNSTLVAGSLEGHSLRIRVGAVIAGLALIFGMVVLMQDRADAVPSGHAAVASATVGVDNAQIDFGQFVCPFLLAVRTSFANSPFFSFVAAALNPFLVRFGCIPSLGG